MAGGRAQRARAHRATRSRSTTARHQDARSHHKLHPRRPAATARPTRSRSTPATTWAAAHGRRTPRSPPGASPTSSGAPNASAGDGTISASWSTPAANGRPIDHYEVEHTRGGNKNVGGNSTSWNVHQRHDYRVRVRACNVVGCAAWSAWSQSVHPAGARRRRCDVTASYYGDAQGQPGCSSSRCVYVRVEATGLQPNTTYTVTCNYPANQGLERHQRDHRTAPGASLDRAGVLLRPGRGILGHGRQPPFEHVADPTTVTFRVTQRLFRAPTPTHSPPPLRPA